MADTSAYLNWGRWVAECSVPDCFDAAELPIGETGMRCVLGHRSSVKWPPNARALEQAVAERQEQNRNWFPLGHPVGEALGVAGQTPDDLREETRLFAPELGTVALPDEDAEAIDRILRKHGLALSADLKHVKER